MAKDDNKKLAARLRKLSRDAQLESEKLSGKRRSKTWSSKPSIRAERRKTRIELGKITKETYGKN